MNELHSNASMGLKKERDYFLDNLRTAVIILVIIHHIAMVYGAFAPFYYTEQPFNKNILVFCIVNQSWFMGILFLLAGYFTPGSFQRKGPVKFLKSKLLRLGLPALFFYFILNPLSSLGIYAMPSVVTGITSGPDWRYYPRLLGLGPLWFVVMLLIFTTGYLVFRLILPGKNIDTDSRQGKSLPVWTVLVFLTGLAIVSYLWRIIVPIGKSVWDFPTLGYLPQYLSFYIVGVCMTRHKTLSVISSGIGITGTVAAIISIIILFPLAFSGTLFSLTLTPQFTHSMGGGTWQSAIYALWDSVFATGLCLGLITIFRVLLNKPGKLGQLLSRLSYTVYIIHIPVIVGITILCKGLRLPVLLKVGLCSVLIIPTCFFLAFLVRKIPGMKKIL